MPKLHAVAASVAASLLLLGASPDPGGSILAALFADPAHGEVRLAPSFVDAEPEAALRALVARLEAAQGPYRSISGAGENYTVHLARADIAARIGLDDEGRVSGLLFSAVVPTGRTITNLATDIAALPGDKSLLVEADGKTLIDLDADTPRAVGSAFKLVVLRSVADGVASRRFSWDQIVRLDPGARSLPSGILQDWPAGTPLTLATLADLMIARSDNTAADLLARLVGRDALDRASPRNAPFLTTREAFALEAGAPANGAERWSDMTVGARRALLTRADAAPLPSADSLSAPLPGGPEWYLTARELCALLEELAPLDAFRIDPGPAMPAEWARIAFKGGSAAGLLSLSVAATGRNGSRICVSAAWNAPQALDTARLLEPVSGLLHALAAARS